MNVLDLKIGTENRTLKVIDIKTRFAKNKHEQTAEKVVLTCKDKAGPEFFIDSALIKVGHEKYSSRDLWLQLDADDQIRKGSILAQLLSSYNKTNLKDLIGEEIMVVADHKNFLLVKLP